MGDPHPLKYQVRNTGYYCVLTQAADAVFDYQAVVEFRNAYGELPAAQIPKLPFYGALALVYAVMCIFWGFLYVQNRHDILAVQNYITAILVFILVEMLMTWGYYNFENIHGSTAGTKAFMIIVAILNAFRNAFSFFLLLIVCMGYGVVKPTLGKTMLYVRGLAAAHFVFCVVYSVASMVIAPEEAGAVVLFVVLPLSSTLTAFYIWTLNSLNMTMKDLVQRKQHVKAGMYRRLWWCILTTIIVIFGFFFLNSFMFVNVSNDDFAPTHWRTRWFVLDGWLNIVYLADVAFIAYLWRPTPNNRRFAMSDEVCSSRKGIAMANSGTDRAGRRRLRDQQRARLARVGRRGRRRPRAARAAHAPGQRAQQHGHGRGRRDGCEKRVWCGGDGAAARPPRRVAAAGAEADAAGERAAGVARRGDDIRRRRGRGQVERRGERRGAGGAGREAVMRMVCSHM
jgi:hypothetical protein